jgi:hypothetical protein
VIRANGLLGLAAGIALLLGLAQAALALDRNAPRAIAIKAYPFQAFSLAEPERRVFGKLTFLGGMELRSPDPDFGGISGLVVDPDGRGFVAVTDSAYWLTGRIGEEGGRPAGIEAARIAPMIGPGGIRMKRSRYFDVEGIARSADGYVVSVERVNEMLRFGPAAPGTAEAARAITAGRLFKDLDNNLGIEAIGVLPTGSPHAGRIIAIAERAPRNAAERHNPAFLIGPGGGQLAVRRTDDFDITDLAFLPGGDMLILERRFVPLFGLAFRIRRVALAAIRPGALLDGEVLIEADFAHQIDNMEALAVHRAEGRTILTLFSDDNFSILQRTLILRFALEE